MFLSSLYLQRERALPSAADSDSSVDRLDLEHDIQKGCIGKDKVRNACHGQHRRYYNRNRKNDKYENEDLDAEQSGPKSQRKVEGTSDDTPGVATISSFNCNEGDNDPEKESKVRNDDKNAIMHSAMRAQTVQVNQQIIEFSILVASSIAIIYTLLQQCRPYHF
jgi:hypothetical protein